jgi:CRP-like cAMP-binding protein
MVIEDLSGILSAHPFFRDLAPAYLATLVGCAANTTFEAGEFVFREGGPADRFYVLRHGKVALEVFVPGRGAVTVETLEADDVLGWSWLFPPYTAHFDARALTLVRALALDGVCLRSKCEKDPALGYALLRRFALILVQRLDATRTQLLDLYGGQP